MSLIASAVGYVASQGLEQVEQMVQAAMRAELRRNLRTQLAEYQRRSTPQEFTNLLGQPDVAAFRLELENRVGTAFGDALDNISSEDQDLVNAFRDRALADTLRDGFGFLASTQELALNEIEQNRANIIGLARTFDGFAERNQGQLDTIINAQSEIMAGLQSLNDAAGETQQGVEFIQEFVFGQLSPGEQLNALQRGVFPGLSDEERNDLIARTTLVQRRVEFEQSVVSYLNGASELVNIARGFGVSPEIVGTLQGAVGVGNEAFNAFTAFSSGNFLASVSAIANIFGLGGGRDIAAERHEQVIGALRDLRGLIQGIDQKVDLLIQGQEQIVRNQREIFDALLQLSEQVQTGHREVIERLQELQGDVLYNRRLIVDRVGEEYALCRVFINHPITGDVLIDTGQARYPTHEEFVDLYSTFRIFYRQCVIRQQQTRGNNLDFNTIFSLETYVDRDNNVRDYIDNIYNPALQFLQTCPFPSKTLDERISSLLSPMTDVVSLEQKVATVTNAHLPRFQRSFQALMSRPLAPSAVEMHTELILNYHYYYQLINPNTENPFTLEELLGLRRTNQAGRFALFENLNLVDIAIAQQCLVSGDILLPMMHEIFRQQAGAPSAADNEFFARSIQLLRDNSLLARNFILYILRKEVSSRSNFLNYSIALSSTDNDPFILRRITEFPWDFQRSDVEVMDGAAVNQPAGWSVRLDESFFGLPSAEELSEGKLIYHPDLLLLMRLRSRILDEINSYDFLKEYQMKTAYDLMNYC